MGVAPPLFHPGTSGLMGGAPGDRGGPLEMFSFLHSSSCGVFHCCMEFPILMEDNNGSSFHSDTPTVIRKGIENGGKLKK